MQALVGVDQLNLLLLPVLQDSSEQSLEGPSGEILPAKQVKFRLPLVAALCKHPNLRGPSKVVDLALDPSVPDPSFRRSMLPRAV
jgi:hypothetical protein